MTAAFSSAVDVNTITSRRTFRPHLHRWDYEPYGIGIRKSRLAALGARSVAYGVSADYEKLSADEQPFFQMQVTRDQRTDCTDEAEWRTVGDIGLRELSGDIFVFVPTKAEADAVSQYCHWPIVVLANGSD